MDSGYDAKLELVEEQHKKDLQRLENLKEKSDLKNFIDEINKRIQTLEDDSTDKQQTVPEQYKFSSPLSLKVAEDDKEIVDKKIQYAKELIALADKKLNPEYYATKERTASFVSSTIPDPSKRGSLREPMLSRTRTSSSGESTLKTVRSSSTGTTKIQTTSSTPLVKPIAETTSIESTTIDKDMEEIARLFRQAAGQGYKKENAEEISRYLTNLATTLFLQIRESDVVNPKRHKEKDSTDVRYSQFSNRLSEMINASILRLNEELNLTKSPDEKQIKMQEKEKLFRMLIKIAEDLSEKRNFIALMSVALILDSHLSKKANAEIKEKLPKEELEKLQSYAKLYAPGSSELGDLQEKYADEKKPFVPHIGSMKYRFVYIEEHKKDDKKRESMAKQEAEQVRLFRLYQQNLARESKQHLQHIKLKYSETELKEVEAHIKELHQAIESSLTFEDRQKIYEQLMSNFEKVNVLLNEQKNILKNILDINPLLAKKAKGGQIEELQKIRGIEARRINLSEEIINTQKAMLFNEVKTIAKMEISLLIDKYSDAFNKPLEDLNSMLSKLSNDTMDINTKIDILKVADLIMRDLDSKATAINHRGKELSLSGEKAKPLIDSLNRVAAIKEVFNTAKMSIDSSLGRKDSVSLHTTMKPHK